MKLQSLSYVTSYSCSVKAVSRFVVMVETSVFLNFTSQVICTAHFPAGAMRCEFINAGSSLSLWKKFIMLKENGGYALYI